MKHSTTINRCIVFVTLLGHALVLSNSLTAQEHRENENSWKTLEPLESFQINEEHDATYINEVAKDGTAITFFRNDDAESQNCKTKIHALILNLPDGMPGLLPLVKANKLRYNNVRFPGDSERRFQPLSQLSKPIPKDLIVKLDVVSSWVDSSGQVFFEVIVQFQHGTTFMKSTPELWSYKNKRFRLLRIPTNWTFSS